MVDVALAGEEVGKRAVRLSPDSNPLEGLVGSQVSENTVRFVGHRYDSSVAAFLGESLSCRVDEGAEGAYLFSELPSPTKVMEGVEAINRNIAARMFSRQPLRDGANVIAETVVRPIVESLRDHSRSGDIRTLVSRDGFYLVVDQPKERAHDRFHMHGIDARTGCGGNGLAVKVTGAVPMALAQISREQQYRNARCMPVSSCSPRHNPVTPSGTGWMVRARGLLARLHR